MPKTIARDGVRELLEGGAQVVDVLPAEEYAESHLPGAIDESRRLGHDHIGMEHLLLGIIHEGEGVANVILEKAGALDKVARVRTLMLLEQRDTESQTPKDQG